ncbi:MAG: endonuclease/exonuclease/phosphatase family protein, partial [Bdellovibrionaceae bacterium]|nr:endonuclease/exonuclease/phosphatase family protein [Pseudobdellovibrionaceae bacterium]
AMPVVWQESFGHFQWSMATSFLPRYAHPTGVATGSSIQPLAVDFIRGSEREFFVLTPKISLLSHFRLPDGQTLLVINTHFVNFTTTKAFVRFLTELLDTVSHHRGPMIMAGDFNTWSRRRWATLLETLVREDIFPVEFAKDRRLLKLDHVFYRGMTLAKAEIHHHIRSSDHFPLEVHFDIAPSFERTGAE